METKMFDVENAIPLGLIVNELITNSIKYAFHGRTEGKICVNLWEEKNSRPYLEVSDNGSGIADHDGPSSAFGTDLIKNLSKKLKGRIPVSNQLGYRTTITFERYTLGRARSI